MLPYPLGALEHPLPDVLFTLHQTSLYSFADMIYISTSYNVTSTLYLRIIEIGFTYMELHRKMKVNLILTSLLSLYVSTQKKKRNLMQVSTMVIGDIGWLIAADVEHNVVMEPKQDANLKSRPKYSDVLTIEAVV